MTLDLFIGASTITVNTASLRPEDPGGLPRETGAATNLTIQVLSSVGEAFLLRGDLGSLGDWQASANDNDLTGSITFEIE